MDAIEPEIMEQAEVVIHEQAEMKVLQRLRMRGPSHTLHVEVQIAAEPSLTTAKVFDISERLRHKLFHEIDHLAMVAVNIEPWSENPGEYARVTAHPHHGPHHQHI